MIGDANSLFASGFTRGLELDYSVFVLSASVLLAFRSFSIRTSYHAAPLKPAGVLAFAK